MNKHALNSVLLLGVCLAVANAPVYAYEIETHGFLTHQAYLSSVLKTDSTLLPALGIEETYDQLGSYYYDMVLEPNTPDVKARKIYDYEKTIIEDSLGLAAESGAISGWMMQGAIREDDVYSAPYPDCITADNPQDDKYPDPPHRPGNHFYDPVNDAPLNPVPFWVDIEKSPDWGSGFVDSFAADPTPNVPRRNHFTILDAREAMYRALTGRKLGDPNDPSFPNVPNAEQIGPGGIPATNAIRKAYWATTFRALGDIVHLVEDMGQPQHTRNDTHSGRCLVLGDKSVLEKYINARVIQQPVARKEAINADPTATVTTFPAISLSQYPNPTFNRYSEYWSTREGMTGRGLGDFSNREFFSAGTNLGDNVYTSPSNTRSDYQVVPTWPTDKAGIVNYLAAPVNDYQQSGQPLTGLKTRESILDDALFAFSKRDYSLDKTVYDVQAAFLLPRAVAYSAGLLDYFFRGRLAVSLPPEGIYGIIDHNAPHALVNNVTEKGASGGGGVFGFEKIILNVSNATPDIDDGVAQTPYPQDIGAGIFRAVAHYRLNPCYTTDLSGETGTPTPCDNTSITDPANEERIATSEAVAVSSFDNNNPNRIEFDFSAEPIPVNAADLKIQVVYYGELGDEQRGIAVGMKDISEPSYFAVHNSSDYSSWEENASLGPKVYRFDEEPFKSWAEANLSPPGYMPYTAGTAGYASIKFGNLAGAVQTPTFDAGEFVRIAYLADYAPVTVTSNISPILGAVSIITPRTVSIDQDNHLTFHIIGSIGGSTNRLYSNSFYNLSHGPYPVGSQMGSYLVPLTSFPLPVKAQVTVCFPSCS